MICPYNQSKIEQVLQDAFTYDEHGAVTFHQMKQIEKRIFAKCREAECGAYRDGKCRYGKG